MLKHCRELSLFDGAYADPGRDKLLLGYIECPPAATKRDPPPGSSGYDN
jgi:hypothetical protein